MITLIIFLALLALIMCIAIVSIRASKKRNKTPQLDNEIFERRDK
jgi:hypothetical protein